MQITKKDYTIVNINTINKQRLSWFGVNVIHNLGIYTVVPCVIENKIETGKLVVKIEKDYSTLRRPSPANCARSFPFGPMSAKVGHELTPNSFHKLISPSLTTYYQKWVIDLNFQIWKFCYLCRQQEHSRCHGKFNWQNLNDQGVHSSNTMGRSHYMLSMFSHSEN